MAVNKVAFLKVWPRCFIGFLGVIELLAALILIATELGNVAANFWTANVFAGGWCGIVMLVHFLALCVAGCCSPGPPSAFRAVVISVIAILANGCLIGFDAYFIAQPSTCILTSSCATNAASTTNFGYYFQQAFFTLWNNLPPFKTYNQTQSKFLFQTIQLGVGSLCFVLCIIYLIIYYVCTSKANKGQVSPVEDQGQHQNLQQSQRNAPAFRPPRAPQANPGEVAWNNRSKY